MPWNRDREWKVKWKCSEIEIEKWNWKQILENSWETRLSQGTGVPPWHTVLSCFGRYSAWKFGVNSGIWSKFWNMVEIQKYGGNSEFLVKIPKFDWNSEIWLKFRNLVQILKFGQNFEIWLKFRNLVEITKFGWNCKILLKIWDLRSEIWDLRSDLKQNDNWRQLDCRTTPRVESWMSCFLPHQIFRFLEDI